MFQQVARTRVAIIEAVASSSAPGDAFSKACLCDIRRRYDNSTDCHGSWCEAMQVQRHESHNVGPTGTKTALQSPCTT